MSALNLPPIVVIDTAFGPAVAVRRAVKGLEAAGYVVLVGDPAAVRALDVLTVGRVQMDALTRAAFETIAEHNSQQGPGAKTLFGAKVAAAVASSQPEEGR